MEEQDVVAEALSPDFTLGEQSFDPGFHRRFRRIRSKLSADLDVWAAVEICRAVDPSTCPTRDDALGKWEELEEVLQEYHERMALLRLRAEEKVRNKRPLSVEARTKEAERAARRALVVDAKFRVAIVDLLVKYLTSGASNKTGRKQRTVKSALTSRGLAPEIDTWSEVEDALDSSLVEGARSSALMVRPRKGRWSGFGQRGRGMHEYRQLARHRRIVARFLDELASELAEADRRT